MANTCALTMFTLFTCLLTLAGLGLTGYHTLGHLYYNNKTAGVVLRENTNDTDDCPPAVQIKIEGFNVNTGDEEVYIASCPWRPHTKYIGLLACALCQFFLIVVCCKAKGKLSSSCFGFSSFFVCLLLTITVITMIVDVIAGKDKYPKGETTTYQPLTYILNILFVALGLVCALITTCIALQGKPAGSSAQGRNYPNQSQPSQAANNSTIVGMNKSGYEDSVAYGNNVKTHGYSETSFVANHGNNNNGYLENTNAFSSQGYNNRAGGNLQYQTNNAQVQNMNFAVQQQNNNRGYVGNRNMVENNMMRREQQPNYANHGSDTSNRSSVTHEGRDNRRVIRNNNSPVRHNNANNNYANNSGAMPQAANYRGY